MPSRPTGPARRGPDASGRQARKRRSTSVNTAGLLGVHPVARALDRDPAVAREVAVHRGGVLVADVSGVLPGDPQRLPVVRRARGQRLLRPAAELVDVAAEHGQVGLPRPAVALAAQVLEQEAAHRRVGHGLDQRGVGLAAALQRGQVERLHRVDVAGELTARAVGHGRHVDDAQPLDQLGMPQRQHHRRLPTHRVADQGDRILGTEELGHLVGDVHVVEVVAPARPPVVGHVDQEHPVVGRDRLRDRGPVLALAEEAMAEGHEWAGLPQRGGVEGHGSSLDQQQRGRRAGRADLRSRSRRRRRRCHHRSTRSRRRCHHRSTRSRRRWSRGRRPSCRSHPGRRRASRRT